LKLFSGIHEVVCKRADGKLYVGFFDDEKKALSSVDNDSTYQAVWYGLNPLKQLPEGATLNGALRRSNRSKKDWILRRERLLIDFDPHRTYGNASDSEKAAARRQVLAVRDYLRSIGWPEPMLCDSGNGFHVVFAIDLPNDQSSEDLVRGVLLALAAKFDTPEAHVDTGNFEANRLCKLPGTWARKAPATPERPHRQSGVIECPEILQPVPRALLESVSAGHIAERPTLKIPANDELKMEWLRGFLEHYKVPVVAERQSGQRYFVDVECPWSEEHGSPSGDTTSSVGYERGWGYSYKCFHSECTKEERGWKEFRQRITGQNPDVPAYGNALAHLPSECSHADVARYFIEHEAAAKNHVQLYDLAQRAVFVRTRWAVGDAGDRLLLRDVGECCDRLRWDMPEPDDPKRDYRAKLKSHQFRSAALKQIETLLPPVNYGRRFDQNGYLLGLPDGRVMDIRTAEIRSMEHGDYITKRITVMPDPKMATPVFDKFMREISNENGKPADEAWIAYMLRFCGYCLLGEYPEHVWPIWVGSGRNGKGCLERVIESILGEFAVHLRWSEIAEQAMGAENTLKRTAFKLMGARVAFVEESGEETGRRKIETSSVKYFTGGDVLVGAAMRQNEVHRRPSHKLVTITNHLPIISPDPAMLGRVQVVPFRASFLGREDPTVEPEMRKETAGILYRWMIAAREFLEIGLKPPQCVLDASKELFAEGDIVGRFIRERLNFTPSGYATSEALQLAYSQFVHEIGQPDTYIQMNPLYRRLKTYPGVASAPRRVNEAVRRVWNGITVKDDVTDVTL
jgi:P4 family phage/plasmid primase-like protien